MQHQARLTLFPFRTRGQTEDLTHVRQMLWNASQPFTFTFHIKLSKHLCGSYGHVPCHMWGLGWRSRASSSFSSSHDYDENGLERRSLKSAPQASYMRPLESTQDHTETPLCEGCVLSRLPQGKTMADPSQGCYLGAVFHARSSILYTLGPFHPPSSL